jgi:hypothetical protein
MPFVKQCGYLAFYQVILSDHCWLYLDLSLELIDGLTCLETTPMRYLRSSFIYQYKQQVQKEFTSHNIYDQATSLIARSSNVSATDEMFQQQLASLDSSILNIQLKVEISCCKKCTCYDWSDDIYYTNKRLLYCHSKRKHFTRQRDITHICNNELA